MGIGQLVLETEQIFARLLAWPRHRSRWISLRRCMKWEQTCNPLIKTPLGQGRCCNCHNGDSLILAVRDQYRYLAYARINYCPG